ncbi:MAG: NAD-dependent epimerase/dehydratase [Bryobacterales bacterium]|nr:NAD-dependent epimerase/dehydratase [Bryobacterales bacterium]
MPRLPEQDLDHVLSGACEAWKALKQTRVFITGGTGFVGSWLLETLLYANDRLDLGISATVLTRDPDRFQAANPHLANHPAVELLHGDVRTFDFPSGEFPLVIHAALPEPCLDIDIAGMRHILEFAGAHGTGRFLFTSSGAVYGKQPPDLRRIPEDYCGTPSTTDPGTAYGHAKRASEFLSASYGRQHGFAAVIARLFAFTGPRLPLDRNFAVGNFVRDVLAGGPIRIQGDGTPYRSYLYAADLAVWLWTLAVRSEPFQPYNVGSGEDLTIAELAGVVAEATVPGTPIEIVQKPVPGAAAMRYVPSVERAERELGLRPAIALQEGVRRMYDWALTEIE